MGYDSWETPPDFFAALDAEFHFTLDAAASHENHLLPRYHTIDGFFENGVMKSHADGLQCWSGERVFCNPPYSKVAPWVEQSLKREAEISVLLLSSNVADTAWFHRLADAIPAQNYIGSGEIWGRKWSGFGAPPTSLYFMQGRLRFYRDGKPGDAPRAGNLLAVIRR